jgi:hypothetical protein
VRQKRIQQQEQAAKDREQKRKEQIEARKQAARQEAAKQAQPVNEKELTKHAAVERAAPAQLSVEAQEAAFLAEQKEKERKLKEEEKDRARLAREETVRQREMQKQARLKEQQARKEEELRIVRESQQALSKQNTRSKHARQAPEKTKLQAEQKAQPPVQKPALETSPVSKEKELVQQPQLSQEQVLQKRSDNLKVYATQIKKELIDQESSQLRSPDSYDPDVAEKIAQESVRPARRLAGSHPVATQDELARKQAMERSFRDESQRTPRRRPSRERAVNNALDKIDFWLEENLW